MMDELFWHEMRESHPDWSDEDILRHVGAIPKQKKLMIADSKLLIGFLVVMAMELGAFIFVTTTY